MLQGPIREHVAPLGAALEPVRESAMHALDSAYADLPGPASRTAFAPQRLEEYLRLMRLDRPIGIWLLLWPTLWACGSPATGGRIPECSWSSCWA